MNKQELEKKLNEAITELDCYWDLSYNRIENFKDTFFETIIPEVLKSVIPDEDTLFYCEKQIVIEIKQKAKELYNINL
jgi:hypothetical protein